MRCKNEKLCAFLGQMSHLTVTNPVSACRRVAEEYFLSRRAFYFPSAKKTAQLFWIRRWHWNVRKRQYRNRALDRPNYALWKSRSMAASNDTASVGWKTPAHQQSKRKVDYRSALLWVQSHFALLYFLDRGTTLQGTRSRKWRRNCAILLITTTFPSIVSSPQKLLRPLRTANDLVPIKYFLNSFNYFLWVLTT